MLNETIQSHTVSPWHLRVLIQPTTIETAPPTFKLCRPYPPAGVDVPHQSALSGATLTIAEHMPSLIQKARTPDAEPLPPMTHRRRWYND